MTPTRAFEAEAALAAFVLAPSGAEMAGALKNGKTQVWSVAGKPLRSWASPGRPRARGGARAMGRALFYAGDRRIVAVEGGYVAVLDASSGRKVAAWEAHERDIESVSAANDGSLLATASDDGTVKLWEPDGSAVRTIAGGPGEIVGVAVSPGGERIAGAGSDANIRLFDGKTGSIRHVLDLEMSCFALAFSVDGRTLAAGSVDGSLTLWDAESGAARGTLGRYAVPVGAVRFSADGKRLASTGLSINPPTAETEARVWDLSTRKVTATPIGISNWNTVGFAPDGRPIVVGIRDRTVSVWELPLE